MKTQPPDLITILADGSMKAVAEIAAAKGILNQLDAQKVCDALRVELKAGYFQAAAAAKDALDAVGSAWATKSLNVSCNEFALRALQSAGYLRGENS